MCKEFTCLIEIGKHKNAQGAELTVCENDLLKKKILCGHNHTDEIVLKVFSSKIFPYFGTIFFCRKLIILARSAI